MSRLSPVAAGIVEKSQWEWLREKARTGDAKAYTEYAKELCHRNVPLWNYLFVGDDVTPHMSTFRKEIEEHDKVIVEIARSTSKSRYFSIGEVSHHIAYSTVLKSDYRRFRGLLIQESGTVAENTVRAIRNLFESGGPGGIVHAAFGDLRKDAIRWTDNQIWVKNDDVVGKDPTLFAIGARSAVTGAHPTDAYLDDPVSQENSKTPHLREQMWNWWSTTIQPMFDPGTRVRLMCTPYFQDDLRGRLKETGSFHVIRRPILNRYPTKDDYTEVLKTVGDQQLRIGVTLTDAGKDLVSLWPCPFGTGNCPNTKEHYEEYGVHRSVEWIIHEKYLGDPIGFASQFMLDLVSGADARIKKDMLRFYTMDKNSVGTEDGYGNKLAAFPLRDEVIHAVHGWDHAIGKKVHNDRTACAMLYRAKDNRVYVRVIAGRWSFNEAVRKMESFYSTDPVRKPIQVITEGIGFQEAYTQVLQEKSNVILPLVTLKKASDKDTMLAESGLIQHLMAGMVYFDIADKETILELLSFTPEQKFSDDRVDAVRMAFTAIRDLMRRTTRVFKIR